MKHTVPENVRFPIPVFAILGCTIGPLIGVLSGSAILVSIYPDAAFFALFYSIELLTAAYAIGIVIALILTLELWLERKIFGANKLWRFCLIISIALAIFSGGFIWANVTGNLISNQTVGSYVIGIGIPAYVAGIVTWVLTALFSVLNRQYLLAKEKAGAGELTNHG